MYVLKCDQGRMCDSIKVWQFVAVWQSSMRVVAVRECESVTIWKWWQRDSVRAVTVWEWWQCESGDSVRVVTVWECDSVTVWEWWECEKWWQWESVSPVPAGRCPLPGPPQSELWIGQVRSGHYKISQQNTVTNPTLRKIQNQFIYTLVIISHLFHPFKPSWRLVVYFYDI